MKLKIFLSVFGYGGLHARTHKSIFDELTRFPSQVEWTHRVITDDALIDRSRSRALSSFVRAVDNDDRRAAFAMVDHDIAWRTGDLARLANTAASENAVVGGLYACRGMRAGFSSRLVPGGAPFKFGGGGLHEAQHVATGFMAGSISAVRLVLEHCWVPDAPPGVSLRWPREPPPEWARITECVPVASGDGPWWDFFRPVPLPETLPGYEGKWNYASEDWAFCARARHAGVRLLISEAPQLVHYGQFGFTPAHGLPLPEPEDPQ